MTLTMRRCSLRSWGRRRRCRRVIFTTDAHRRLGRGGRQREDCGGGRQRGVDRPWRRRRLPVTVGLSTDAAQHHRQPRRTGQAEMSRREPRHEDGTSSEFIKPRLHDTTCCQTGCQTGLYNRFDKGFDNRLYRVYKHLPGCIV